MVRPHFGVNFLAAKTFRSYFFIIIFLRTLCWLIFYIKLKNYCFYSFLIGEKLAFWKSVRGCVFSAHFTFILYIICSLRGVHINVSDYNGKVLKMFSTGKLGYKKAERYNSVSLNKLAREVLVFLQSKNIKLIITIENKNPYKTNMLGVFNIESIKNTIKRNKQK